MISQTHNVSLFQRFDKSFIVPTNRAMKKLFEKPIVSILCYAAVIVGIGVFLVIDSWDSTERLVSAGGILIIVGFGAFFSAYPGFIQWRAVVWGIGLEFFMGFLVLRWETGQAIFNCLGDKVAIFLGYTDYGSSFVFSYLVTQQPIVPEFINITNETYFTTEEVREIARALVTQDPEGNFPFLDTFMFKTLSVIYFFSFCVSMLFYVGALQWIVLKMGWMLNVTMGTTAAESLNAAANIFLGQTEAPLLIKPFMPKMTK